MKSSATRRPTAPAAIGAAGSSRLDRRGVRVEQPLGPETRGNKAPCGRQEIPAGDISSKRPESCHLALVVGEKTCLARPIGRDRGYCLASPYPASPPDGIDTPFHAIRGGCQSDCLPAEKQLPRNCGGWHALVHRPPLLRAWYQVPIGNFTVCFTPRRIAVRLSRALHQ